jgi:hypothetical protein
VHPVVADGDDVVVVRVGFAAGTDGAELLVDGAAAVVAVSYHIIYIE